MNKDKYIFNIDEEHDNGEKYNYRSQSVKAFHHQIDSIIEDRDRAGSPPYTLNIRVLPPLSEQEKKLAEAEAK